MEKDLCRGVVYFTVFVRSSLPCFLTFCRSGIPTSCYIFIVFYYFTRLVMVHIALIFEVIMEGRLLVQFTGNVVPFGLHNLIDFDRWTTF